MLWNINPSPSSSCRSSHPEVFIGKGFPKICSKFTGEHPCRSAILIMLQSIFIEITLWHGCSPVNLLHISRTPFLKNTSGRLLLFWTACSNCLHKLFISDGKNKTSSIKLKVFFIFGKFIELLLPVKTPFFKVDIDLLNVEVTRKPIQKYITIKLFFNQFSCFLI